MVEVVPDAAARVITASGIRQLLGSSSAAFATAEFIVVAAASISAPATLASSAPSPVDLCDTATAATARPATSPAIRGGASRRHSGLPASCWRTPLAPSSSEAPPLLNGAPVGHPGKADKLRE